MAATGGNQDPRSTGGAGWLSQELTSVRFAAAARRLSEAARSVGIDPPGFRSPPRTPGRRRSIRREADGSATVSVALRGRPALAVIGDMIDGVVAAGGVEGVEGAQVRDELWTALAGLLDDEMEATLGSMSARFAA